MRLADEFEGLKAIGDLVLLYGRDVIISIGLLVAGLILAKTAVKYLRRLLERFVANKAIVATICNSIFVLLAVIAFVVALEQAGARSVVLNRIVVAGALLAMALIFLVRPFIPGVPFKVGNMVQIGGVVGKVEAITLISTRLKGFDGKTHFIPNQKILNDNVVNYHFTPERQIRLPVTIGYKDDLVKAMNIFKEIMASDSRALNKPAPKVYVVNLGDNGVELSGRCWVENAKYWACRCALLEKTKLRFDAEGISFAFPQRDVHLHGLVPGPEKQEESQDTETV